MQWESLYNKLIDGSCMQGFLCFCSSGLHMEFLKKLFKISSVIKPVSFKRYVDYTFCITKRGTERHILNPGKLIYATRALLWDSLKQLVN